MTNNDTTAAHTFDIFANASGSRVHLADAAEDAVGFLCGAPAGRSKWACHAVNVPLVRDSFGCAACVAEMHRLNG